MLEQPVESKPNPATAKITLNVELKVLFPR
jgi:hypothetical protein